MTSRTTHADRTAPLRVQPPSTDGDDAVERTGADGAGTDDTPGTPPPPVPPPDLPPDLLLERRLIDRWRQGSREALAELLSLHEGRIYGVCLRMVNDAEAARDLAQDTLVKVIQGLDRFDERARLSTWITRIAMNVCLTHRRRQLVRRTSSLDAPAQGPETAAPSAAAAVPDHREPGVASAVESREARRLLEQALTRLDPEQRAILLLRDGHAMDYADIALVLDIPQGTVKSRLFRARTALRAEIDRLDRASETPMTP